MLGASDINTGHALLGTGREKATGRERQKAQAENVKRHRQRTSKGTVRELEQSQAENVKNVKRHRLAESPGNRTMFYIKAA